MKAMTTLRNKELEMIEGKQAGTMTKETNIDLIETAHLVHHAE